MIKQPPGIHAKNFLSLKVAATRKKGIGKHNCNLPCPNAIKQEKITVTPNSCFCTKWHVLGRRLKSYKRKGPVRFQSKTDRFWQYIAINIFTKVRTASFFAVTWLLPAPEAGT